MPLPVAFFLKSLHKDYRWSTGYICGYVLNVTAFSKYIGKMAENGQSPSTAPIKFMIILNAIVLLAWLLLVMYRCLKAKKWIGFECIFYVGKESMDQEQFGMIDLPTSDKIHFIKWELNKEVATKIVLGISAIVYLTCIYRILAFLPTDGLRQLADVNRIDFYGLVNSDYSVMVGYYFNKLLGMGSYYSIGIIIPLAAFVAIVMLCYEAAEVLCGNNSFYTSFCFMIEGILIVLGDCAYSHASIMLHGAGDASLALTITAIPIIFITGMRFLFYKGSVVVKTTEDAIVGVDAEGNDKHSDVNKLKFNLPTYWISVALMLYCCYLIDTRVILMALINVFIFILLFIGRGYFPCMKSSK